MVSSVHKTFFDLSKGFTTELSPLGMPGGTTIAESNFEILRDGTRRRRKAILPETGGSSYAFSGTNSEYPSDTSTFASFRWHAVANNPDLVFIVAKLGSALHFWYEDDTLSANKYPEIVDLRPYTSLGDSEGDYDYVNDNPVTMATMHGRLFVSGKYLNPLYITYNDDGTFSVDVLSLRIRDLQGIADAVPIGEKPATLSATHNYNLANRGWNATTLGYYFAGQLADGTFADNVGFYPAKNQIWWKALVRWSDNSEYQNGMSDINKLRVFDTAAIEQEVWGTTSAPQGHLFLNPFDTRIGTTNGVEDVTEDTRAITAVAWAESGATVGPAADGSYTKRLRFRLTLDNDEPTNGSVDWTAGTDITLHGTVVRLNLRELDANGNRKTIDVDLSGLTYDVVSGGSHNPTVTTIHIDYYHTGALLYTIGSPSAIYNSTVATGSASRGGFYAKSTGYQTPLRPSAVATFAGRVWLGGCDHPEMADTLFFSQVGNSTVDGVKAYSKIYQEGDPASEYLNIVVGTDGGTIQIPGLTGVKALVPVGSSIIVLAEAGIWEINGGNSFFSANSINVRKLSDVEIRSPQGWALTDHGMIVSSPRGIFKVEDDSQSGRLNIGSLTLETIQTYWQTIRTENHPQVQLVYDNALYRLYVLYKRTATDTTQRYTEALVYDLQKECFYRLDLTNATNVFIHGAAIVNDVNSSNDNKKLKFFVVTLDTSLLICDMAHTTFEDFDEIERIPYLETGYDGLGEGDYRGQEAAQDAPDHHNHKYSPYVYVHMKTTETGIDEDTLEVINPSSLLMHGRFDFTSSNVTGKHGTSQQVYRPRFDGTGLPTGYEVITSKSRVRGRGRALSLRFVGEAGHDAHLLGYSIEYTV